MQHSIRDKGNLPSITNFLKFSRSLAILDAAISQDWEYRYFSFNSNWGDGEMMTSMRNGSGGEYFFLFNDAGVAGKLFDPEMATTVSKEIFTRVPSCFASFTNEPAFSLDDITCVVWRSNQDAHWSVSPDRAILPFMKFVAGGPKYYHQWAEGYYELDIPKSIVNSVFEHGRMSPEEAKVINSDINLGQFARDLSEIG